ncbi:hypothetical protein [Xylella fastidiosa]|uniref:Uncharacterized protein n=1 Tax=Xylella fastidiosa subsp. fastidiosa TaxID=644356 RepID=A0AAJ5QY14_XYLFS|nr:hypothetical protein [Xylella fastidiosa]WCF27241.1 hypothetical protein OK117_06090 [Xylella fastidiosa subsp. fastidiosa]
MNEEKELEKRVALQEHITGKLVTEVFVTKLVAKALITAHPYPKAVKKAFQLLVSTAESQMPDDWFSLGVPVEASRFSQKQFADTAEKWVRLFQKLE